MCPCFNGYVSNGTVFVFSSCHFPPTHPRFWEWAFCNEPNPPLVREKKSLFHFGGTWRQGRHFPTTCSLGRGVGLFSADLPRHTRAVVVKYRLLAQSLQSNFSFVTNSSFSHPFSLSISPSLPFSLSLSLHLSLSPSLPLSISPSLHLSVPDYFSRASTHPWHHNDLLIKELMNRWLCDGWRRKWRRKSSQIYKSIYYKNPN